MSDLTARAEKLARTFAMEFLTGHQRPLREDEQQRFDQLFVVMLAFSAQANRDLLAHAKTLEAEATARLKAATREAERAEAAEARNKETERKWHEQATADALTILALEREVAALKKELGLVREAAMDSSLSDGAARAVAQGTQSPTQADIEWATRVAALKGYVQHKPDCDAREGARITHGPKGVKPWIVTRKPCTCGLAAAVSPQCRAVEKGCAKT